MNEFDLGINHKKWFWFTRSISFAFLLAQHKTLYGYFLWKLFLPGLICIEQNLDKVTQLFHTSLKVNHFITFSLGDNIFKY